MRYVVSNKKVLSLFTDYFRLMQMNLSPETVFLNRESYVVFGDIEEGLVTQIYTDLSQVYTLWRPLKLVLDERRDQDFKEIKRLVLQKNPDYEPIEVQILANTLTSSLEQEVREEETEHKEPLKDVFDFKDASVEPESPMDDESNTVLRTTSELKLYSFMQSHQAIEKERQLQGWTAIVRGVALWVAFGLIMV